MRLKLSLALLVGCFLLLAGFRPDALPYPGLEARYSDSVTAHWPNALFLRESILDRGEFPLWRETTMAGQPFAANPLNKTAYPLQWLALFISPPALHLNILILLHLLLAGSGMWMWSQSLGLRREAVALSTLAYVLAPRMMGHLGAGHLDVVYALAWWPWLMWAVCQGITQSGKFFHTVLEVGLLAALIVLADVRVALFALGSGGVYGLVLLMQQGGRNWRPVGRFAAALPIAGWLTVALLIPLAIWQPYTSRASLTAGDAGLYSLEPIHFLGLILPAHSSGAETSTYLGLPILTLAVIAIATASRRNRWLWIAAIAFIILYGMGTNSLLWVGLTKIFPFLLLFRVPARIWLVLALLLPLLAGYGLQWLLDFVEQPARVIGSRIRLIVVGWMAICAAVGAFALVMLPLPKTMGLSALVGGLGLGVLLLLAFSRRLKTQWVALLFGALVLCDLGWTGYQLVHWRETVFWLDPLSPLAEKLSEVGTDRIYSPTYSLEQQVAELYHLKLFGGVDPFQLTGIVHAVEQGSGVTSLEYDPVLPSIISAESDEGVAQANQNAVIDTAVLATWNVSHVVAPYLIDNPRLQLLDNVNGINIYANLDYQPRPQTVSIPDWPPGWAGLPDASTVQKFNQITIIAYLFSAVGWVVSLTLFILLKLRKSL